jgi:hypothetical protein
MFRYIQTSKHGRKQPVRFGLSEFSGADFRSQTTDVKRSPDTLNMIWGVNPNQIQTRTGYVEVLNNYILSATNLKEVIYGMFTFVDETYNQLLVHAGTTLYVLDQDELGNIDGTVTSKKTGLSAIYSTSFMFGDYLYILAGKYLRWDGVNIVEVSTIAYTPITMLTALPSFKFTDTYFGDGVKTDFTLSRYADMNGAFLEVYYNAELITTGYTHTTGTVAFDDAPLENVEIKFDYLVEITDGTFNEALNLLSPKRINNFSGDGVSTVFYLDTIDIDSVDEVKTGTSIFAGEITGGEELTVTEDYTVDLTNGTITFGTAPDDAVGNITVTFSKEVINGIDKINECTIANVFGGNNDTRVFLSGNSDYRNVDWHSGLYDPTYFPETGFSYIGSDNTEIMGYVNQFNTQIPIKAGNTQDKTAYLRTYSGIDSYGNPQFNLEDGAVGIGCYSKRSFGYLQGEPIFYSSGGIVGMTGTNVDNQRLIQDRSIMINTKLNAEAGRDDSFALVFEDKYYLFVNEHCYVADARNRFTDDLGQVQYEWLYWNNVPATAGVVYNGYMYIGYNGQIYRFMKNEYDMYSDNGVGIASKWTTPILALSDIYSRKDIYNAYIMLNDIEDNDVTIQANINGKTIVDLGTVYGDRLFRYSEIDYSSFSYLQKLAREAEKVYAGLYDIDNIQFIFSNSGENLSAMSFLIFQADYKERT